MRSAGLRRLRWLIKAVKRLKRPEWLTYPVAEDTPKLMAVDPDELGESPDSQQPVQLPVDGVLDLHTFSPKEVKDLIPDYLEGCLDKGIVRVRIIHGKGIGQLKRMVHSILSKHPDVVSFTLDYPQFGGWGATLVVLKAKAR